MLVSVVVAVMNASKTLQASLDSIAEQAIRYKEVLVIDGGSTDGSIGIIERNAGNIAYWCSEPDRGIYDAWNKALSHASGEWICFLGADDTFANPHSLGQLLDAGSDADIVAGRVAIVDSAGTTRRLVGGPWNWQAMRSHQTIAHPGSLHRATLFTRFGGFDSTLRIAGDYDFLLRLGPTARVRFVDAVVVRMRGGGVSRRSLLPVLMESWRVQARHSAIGPVRATWNFCRANATGAARRALGRE